MLDGQEGRIKHHNKIPLSIATHKYMVDEKDTATTSLAVDHPIGCHGPAGHP